ARPLWKIPAFALTMALCLVMVGNGIRPASAQQTARSLTARLLMTAPDKTIDIDTVTPDGRFGAGSDWSNGDLVVVDLASNGIQLAPSARLSFETLPRWPKNRVLSSRSEGFDEHANSYPCDGRLWRIRSNSGVGRQRIACMNTRWVSSYLRERSLRYPLSMGG